MVDFCGCLQKLSESSHSDLISAVTVPLSLVIELCFHLVPSAVIYWHNSLMQSASLINCTGVLAYFLLISNATVVWCDFHCHHPAQTRSTITMDHLPCLDLL